MSTMLNIPPGFEELAKAFEDPESAAWYVGSAEGRWMTPTEEEWKAEASEDEDEHPATSSSQGR
jgi:hypothetical protein